jgi:hypothetical protein
MKKLKTTKKLQNEVKVFQEFINNYCNKINKEYAKNMNKLIKNIAKGENLDFEMLKEKYLNTINQEVEVKIEINKEHETEIILDTELDNEYVSQSNETKSCEEIIFDKVVIDGTNYYYENKDNGRIYDSSSKIVGIYKNNLFLIN